MSSTAAIVTVGTELTEGLRVDTNTAEVASQLSAAGIEVVETVSVGDDAETLAETFARLTRAHAVVVATGGLGPTHDDITREAAASALGVTLVRDERIAPRLGAVVARHLDPLAAEQVLKQADVLAGAEVIEPLLGTAPGQIATTPAGILALLPGPPAEMRGMLPTVLERVPGAERAASRDLGVACGAESDVQLAAQRVLGETSGVRLTVLARPADVRVILLDRGAGSEVLGQLAERIAAEIGDACYTTTGETLPEALVREARARSLTLCAAESCTGGLVSAAITSVPGSSEVFRGGAVVYANEAKMALLRVREETLRAHGSVSPETAAEMASGAIRALDADVAVSVTGIAGPSGGTPEKPVGLVWFGVESGYGLRPRQIEQRYRGDRAMIRERATAYALDLLRRELLAR